MQNLIVWNTLLSLLGIHTGMYAVLQVGSTLIAIFGFGGYAEPMHKHRLEDCQFCGLSTGGPTPFFSKKVVPVALTEASYSASVIGCT